MSESDDLKRATREAADRLRSRGVRLDGRESADQLTALQEAVERFEDAVTAQGGDLMVDEGSPGHAPQPDDRHFGLPMRGDTESVAAYLQRIDQATETVRRHHPID